MDRQNLDNRFDGQMRMYSRMKRKYEIELQELNNKNRIVKRKLEYPSLLYLSIVLDDNFDIAELCISYLPYGFCTTHGQYFGVGCSGCELAEWRLNMDVIGTLSGVVLPWVDSENDECNTASVRFSLIENEDDNAALSFWCGKGPYPECGIVDLESNAIRSQYIEYSTGRRVRIPKNTIIYRYRVIFIKTTEKDLISWII